MRTWEDGCYRRRIRRLASLVNSEHPTGRRYFLTDRFVTPTPSLDPGHVPSAFWKVIAYVGKDSQELEVKAFLVFQDDGSIERLRQVLGDNELKPFDLYQSSTTLIERLTGLDFPDVAFESNPMLFFESELAEAAGITTPELHRVGRDCGDNCGIHFAPSHE